MLDWLLSGSWGELGKLRRGDGGNPRPEGPRPDPVDIFDGVSSPPHGLPKIEPPEPWPPPPRHVGGSLLLPASADELQFVDPDIRAAFEGRSYVAGTPSLVQLNRTIARLVDALGAKGGA